MVGYGGVFIVFNVLIYCEVVGYCLCILYMLQGDGVCWLLCVVYVLFGVGVFVVGVMFILVQVVVVIILVQIVVVVGICIIMVIGGVLCILLLLWFVVLLVQVRIIGQFGDIGGICQCVYCGIDFSVCVGMFVLVFVDGIVFIVIDVYFEGLQYGMVVVFDYGNGWQMLFVYFDVIDVQVG